MLAQGFLYRRLANRVSEPTFMAVGIALMGTGVLNLAGVTGLASQRSASESAASGTLLLWTFASLTLGVIGFALLTPSAQALVSRRSDPERQGEVLGVNQSASAMARILGPILWLTLYQMTASHVLPFLVGGAMVLGLLPLIPRIRRGGVEAPVL
jgi:hypothetical protein